MNISSTWGNFDEAVAGFVKYNANGIGIVLTLAICIVVLDFDHVIGILMGDYLNTCY